MAIQLGIDIETGKSVQDLNTLNDSMERVVEHFTKIASGVGGVQESLAKLTSVLGYSAVKFAATGKAERQEIELTEKEFKKLLASMEGTSGTEKMAKAINSMAKTMKDSFKQIPTELKAVTDQIKGMSEALNASIQEAQARLFSKVQDSELADEYRKKFNEAANVVKREFKDAEADLKRAKVLVGEFRDSLQQSDTPELMDNKKLREAEITLRNIMRLMVDMGLDSADMGEPFSRAFKEVKANIALARIEYDQFQKEMGAKTATKFGITFRDKASIVSDLKEVQELIEVLSKDSRSTSQEWRLLGEAMKGLRVESTVAGYKDMLPSISAVNDEIRKGVLATKEREKAEAAAAKEAQKNFDSAYRNELARTKAIKEQEQLQVRKASGLDERLSPEETVQALSTIRTEIKSIDNSLEAMKSEEIIDPAKLSDTQTRLELLKQSLSELSRTGAKGTELSSGISQLKAEISGAESVISDFSVKAEQDVKTKIIAMLGQTTISAVEAREKLETIAVAIKKLGDVAEANPALFKDTASTEKFKDELTAVISEYQSLIQVAKNSGLTITNEMRAVGSAVENVAKKVAGIDLVNSGKTIAANLSTNLIGYTKRVDEATQRLEAMEQAARTAGATDPTLNSRQSILDYIQSLRVLQKELAAIISANRNSNDAGVKQLIADYQQLGIVIENADKGVIRLLQGLPKDLSGEALTNKDVLVSQEQEAILKKILSLQERIAASRKLLSVDQSKLGIANAREAIEGMNAELSDLKVLLIENNRELVKAGVSGSHAFTKMDAELQKAQKSLNSFDQQQRAAAASFKNLWGGMSMLLGKFLLFYHTAGTIVNMFQMLTSSVHMFMTDMATVGSEVLSFQRAILALNRDKMGFDTGSKQAREDIAFLKAQANFYGFVEKDMFKFFTTMVKTRNELSLNTKGMYEFLESIFAGAKGIGATTEEFQGITNAITQLLSKGRPAAEELNKQLANFVPGLLSSVTKYLIDIEDPLDKSLKKYRKLITESTDDQGKLKYNLDILKEMVHFVDYGGAKNDLLKAIESAMRSFAKIADITRKDFPSAMARLSNAWKDLQADMATGGAGTFMANAVDSITDMVKDPEFVRGMSTAAAQLAKIIEIFSKLAYTIVPTLIDKVAALMNVAGVDIYKETAKKSPGGDALKRGYYNAASASTINSQTPMLPSSAYGFGMTGRAGLGVINTVSSLRSKASFSDWDKASGDSLNKAITQAALSTGVTAMQQGSLAIEEGILKAVSDPKTQAENAFKLKDKTKQEIEEMFSEAVGTMMGSLQMTSEQILQGVVEEASKFMGLGEKDKLTKAESLEQRAIEEYKSDMALKVVYSKRLGSDGMQEFTDTGSPYVMGPRRLTGTPITGLLGEETNAPDKDDLKKAEIAAAKYKALIAEEQRKLQSIGASTVVQAQLAATSAFESAKANIEAEVIKAKAGDESILGPKGMKEEEIQAKAKELVDIYKQQESASLGVAHRDMVTSMEEFDNTVMAKVRSGRLQGELKNQLEAIIKETYKWNKQLSEQFTGAASPEWIAEQRANIAKAKEMMAQEVFESRNMPLALWSDSDLNQSFELLEKVANEEEKYRTKQIEAQYNLQNTVETMTGKRAKFEIDKTNEAYNEAKKRFGDTKELYAAATAANIARAEEQVSALKQVYGEMFDISSGNMDLQAEEQKLDTLYELNVKDYGRTLALDRKYAQDKQKLIDEQVDREILGSKTFEEYLSRRFAKENGLYDTESVATIKQFEKMYDVISSGASEAGQQIQEAFTGAFTGTVDSWADAWKQIKAIFLKTLAEMIYTAKAKPIMMSMVSGLTGLLPSAAGAATNSLEAARQKSNSGTSDGLFSQIAEIPKSIDKFGKDILGLGDNIKASLTDVLMGAGMGYIAGSILFPDNKISKIGGAIGGAIGTAIGSFLNVPGIGGAIGGLAGSAIANFIPGQKKTMDQGLTVNINEKGLESMSKYVVTKISGGFSLKSLGLAVAGVIATGGSPLGLAAGFGGMSSSKYRTEFDAIDPTLYRQIDSKLNGIFGSISKNLSALGLGADYSNLNIQDKISFKGFEKPEDAIAAWLQKVSGTIAKNALDNNQVNAYFESFRRMGESSADALERLADAMSSLKEAAIDSGVALKTISGGMEGLGLANYASMIEDALGGSDSVREFFSIIKDFIGYSSGAGAVSLSTLSSELEESIKRIQKTYAAGSGSATLDMAYEQQSDLMLRKSDIEARIQKLTGTGGYKQWLSFDASAGTVSGTGKGGVNTWEDVLKWAEKDAGRTKRVNEIKALLGELTGVNSSLSSVSSTIATVSEQLTRTQRSDIDPASLVKSSTFWTDFQEALNSELTPDMIAAWKEAATLASQIDTVRNASVEAAKAQDELTETYRKQRESLAVAAQLFGVSAESLNEVSQKAEALNQKDLPAWFAATGNEMITKLVPGLMDFAEAGESALDVILRMSNNVNTLADSIGVAGVSLQTLSGGLSGIDLAAFAQNLIDTFGSSELVQAAFTRFNKYSNTDDQQKEFGKSYWESEASKRMTSIDQLGVTVDNFWEKYKDAMKQGLSPDNLKKWDYVAQAMENAAEAASAAADSADELAEKLSGLLESLEDKMATLGLSSIAVSLYNLRKEVKETIASIQEAGGSQEDINKVYAYEGAAGLQLLKGLMKDVNSTISSLTLPEYVYQLQQVGQTYTEQIEDAKLLGATQEQLNAILYSSYLKAKEIERNAAQAYISAYDSEVSELNSLKSEKEALIAAVDTARNDYMESLQAEIDKKQEAVDALQDSVDSLTEFVASLKELKNGLLISSGFLSPVEQRGATMSQFAKTASLAASGDEDARGNLSTLASQALEASKKISSYNQYVMDVASVYGKLSGLQSGAESDLTKKMTELDAAKASLEELQKIYDTLKAEADKTKSIEDARRAYEDAQKALTTSTLDEQIALKQTLIDQHTETVEILRKQYDATLSLTDAARQFVTVRDTINAAVPDDSVFKENINKTRQATEKNGKKLDEIIEYLYPEKTSDGTDVGIKTIVAAASVRDGVLQALRAENILSGTGAVPETSVIGLLYGIQNCVCSDPEPSSDFSLEMTTPMLIIETTETYGDNDGGDYGVRSRTEVDALSISDPFPVYDADSDPEAIVSIITQTGQTTLWCGSSGANIPSYLVDLCDNGGGEA